MNDIEGNKIHGLRAIEENILKSWSCKKAGKLSMRDSIRVEEYTEALIYTLWNTDIVRVYPAGDVLVNITGNSDMDYKYYRYGRMNDVIMTQTTKSRLNSFLQYYGFDSLEVHSSMRDWSVKYAGEELKINNWYKLDFENKKLILVD